MDTRKFKCPVCGEPKMVLNVGERAAKYTCGACNNSFNAEGSSRHLGQLIAQDFAKENGIVCYHCGNDNIEPNYCYSRRDSNWFCCDCGRWFMDHPKKITCVCKLEVSKRL